jgi:hypothetical protein
VISIWRQIDTLPRSKEPFLGDKSIESGRLTGGSLMRRAQVHFHHEFEQHVNDDWHPAFFVPKYWKRPTDTGSVM